METKAHPHGPLSASATSIGSRIATLGLFWPAIACLAALCGGFLIHQLTAWPPHEDEALALLVGRDSLGGVVSHVTRDRGGAPLHFLVAWVVAHLGFGLGALRLVSTAFAVASLPLVALLGLRLADRRTAFLATCLAATSWIVLFHAVYGRMYTLFLFLSLCSYLALLRALDGGGRRHFGAWLGVTLLLVATHPYGALVIGGQAVAVVLLRRDRVGYAARWFAALAVAGVPFWLTDIVLAGRFDVGVGGGGEKLGGPVAVLRYLYHAAGDMTAGWDWLLSPVLVAAAVGLAVASRSAQRLSLAVTAVPVLAFLLARLGSTTSPESRHLIFVLPFLLICLVLGLRWLARDKLPIVALAVAGLMAAELSWTWHNTPALFEWEPGVRQEARAQASAYLAATARPDDLLLGYDPLFLGAWELEGSFPKTVLPRADGALALRILRRTRKPLGHGVWVLDRSDSSNVDPQLYIADHAPLPAEAFVTRNFGPFLVIRTREPVDVVNGHRVDPIDGYLFYAWQAMTLGRQLALGDADVNRVNIERAQELYDASRWPSSDGEASVSSR